MASYHLDVTGIFFPQWVEGGPKGNLFKANTTLATLKIVRTHNQSTYQAFYSEHIGRYSTESIKVLSQINVFQNQVYKFFAAILNSCIWEH